VPTPQARREPHRGPMGGFRLGSVFGFEIRIDYSWFVIAFLILWSLSAGVFPMRLPDLAPATYLAMGVVGTVLFFASLVAHELSHSLVARTRGVEVAGITLFVFGGMAHTRGEADNPEDELAIAGVGPLASLVLAIGFWVMAWLGGRALWPEPMIMVAEYLAILNLILAVFNMLPGFPLDGGRLFRAFVWRQTGDLTLATRWATRGGKALGYALIFLGAVQALMGAVVGGLWMVFIGWFLRTTAAMSFEQHLLSGALNAIRAQQVMTPDPSTVSSDISMTDFVEGRLLREPHQGFPVVDDGRVLGLVTLDHARDMAREKWPVTSVAEVMMPAADVTVGPRSTLGEVLETMSGSGSNRILVLDDGRLVGVISASDVSRWIQKEQLIRGGTGR
jgi:Zn-dependent protease/CBS domain-containing protein